MKSLYWAGQFYESFQNTFPKASSEAIAILVLAQAVSNIAEYMGQEGALGSIADAIREGKEQP